MTSSKAKGKRQRAAALRVANKIRLRRAEILRELRRGELTINDVNLNTPALRGLPLVKLLESLRIRKGVGTQPSKATPDAAVRQIRQRLLFSDAKTIGELSSSEKRRVREVVSDVVARQRVAP